MSVSPRQLPKQDTPPNVSRLLRAMPRLAAPSELTTSMRRALHRERRLAPVPNSYALWPTAAAVQLTLIAGLIALYFFAAPPGVAVVRGSHPSSSRSSAQEAPGDRAVSQEQEAGPALPSPMD